MYQYFAPLALKSLCVPHPFIPGKQLFISTSLLPTHLTSSKDLLLNIKTFSNHDHGMPYPTDTYFPSLYFFLVMVTYLLIPTP